MIGLVSLIWFGGLVLDWFCSCFLSYGVGCDSWRRLVVALDSEVWLRRMMLKFELSTTTESKLVTYISYSNDDIVPCGCHRG